MFGITEEVMIKNFTKKLDKFENDLQNYFENSKYKKIYHFLTDTSTFKKTFLLALFYVFLFYLPFTVSTLVFDRIVFFQLDHLFQYSTLVFDFRNRIFTGNFSTWDWKNALGYDYFANFYYVPVDFSLIPFLLFPFAAYHKLMWMSFLLKIIVGTACFAYLLKLYKLSNKTILFASIIYGTADLFFAQNVFPSFTGLIVYIPLLLISIELIIQKKNYFVFSLVIFQMFLFNFYWSWPLSLFMALSLLLRYSYEYITIRNFYKPLVILKTFLFFIKSVLFYLLGVGLAAFFLLPIIGLMQAEPRMGDEFKFVFKEFFQFPTIVYLKTFFKTLVPNLFAYNGYYYDKSAAYFLPTNHIIIYSSILATYTLFQFIILPAIAVKNKLTQKQYGIFKFLKWTTIITFILMFIPAVAFVFSLAQTAYLRWFIFFGVLLIINFAFLYEYKLINKYLLLLFLIISSAFLSFSNYYNDLPEIFNDSFHATDETSSYTMLVTYGVSFLFLIVFFKSKFALQMIFLFEKIAMIVLIFTLLMPEGYSFGVRHHSVYGKEMNTLLKELDNKDDYKVTSYFLYYNDLGDLSPIQNLAYLNNYGGYNNDSTFHSLINPYYKIRRDDTHYRSYLVQESQYFQYLYMDPSQFIISNSNKSQIINGMYGPGSELVASKVIKAFDSTIRVYQKEPDLALGVGFTKYYDLSISSSQFNYMWLDGLYIKDEEMIKRLSALGFEAVKGNMNVVDSLRYDREEVKDVVLEYEPGLKYFPSLKFKEIPINITTNDAEVIMTQNTTIKVLIAKDNNDQMYRCYNLFCNVPENGLKSILVGSNQDSSWDAKYTTLYKIDQDLVDKKIAKLNESKTENVVIDGNTVSSTVTNEEPVIMNYKIGYAPGWKGFVDGEEVEIFSGHGGLISFILDEKGTHDIVLKYETPYLNTGIKITLISTVIFVFLLLVTYKYKPLKKQVNKAYLYAKDNKYNPKTISNDLLGNQNVQEFIRFVIIGIFATLINYIFYYLFLKVVDKNISLIIGYIISFFFNFFASNLFTFKTKPNMTTGYRFIIAHGVNLLNQLILLNLFTFLGLSDTLAPIPVYLITIPLNFLFVRFALKSK
ncbi:MAG: multidrug resistance protein [Haloplasmataceae bacterium]|nr:multidrug resistance protein [Haloplasmataceae bacterium]